LRIILFVIVAIRVLTHIQEHSAVGPYSIGV